MRRRDFHQGNWWRSGRVAARSERTAAADKGSSHRHHRQCADLGPFPARTVRTCYVEGRDLVIEYRSGQGQPDQLAARETQWPVAICIS